MVPDPSCPVTEVASGFDPDTDTFFALVLDRDARYWILDDQDSALDAGPYRCLAQALRETRGYRQDAVWRASQQSGR